MTSWSLSAASGAGSARYVVPARFLTLPPTLVDDVIPNVPVLQWVLSLPIPLRLLLAAQPEMVTPVLRAACADGDVGAGLLAAKSAMAMGTLSCSQEAHASDGFAATNRRSRRTDLGRNLPPDLPNSPPGACRAT
jgi:hypothetical protein